jgi:formylglycine-generating enzyme required for sulfatase activity
MATFDPYRKWLGIAPADQPPNHYRLLGLDLFESDPDVIDAATEQRVAYLRNCATGQHVAESQRLLNEVAAARLCLLNADKRREYDERLRSSLAAKQPAASSGRDASSTDNNVQSRSTEQRDELAEILDQASVDKTPAVSRTTKTRLVSMAPQKLAAVAIGVLVVVFLGFKFFTSGNGSLGDDGSAETSSGTATKKTIPAKSLTAQPAGAEWSANGLKMPFRWCKAGAFRMGSPKTGTIHYEDETLVNVTLSQGFWMGRYEVTQLEWRQVMGSTPWQGQENVAVGDRFPAVWVDWHDAKLFCHTLTEQERRAGRLPKDWEFRLPTEAQWEYACRAGSDTQYSFGDDDSQLLEYAWYMTNSPSLKPVHEVGGKQANAWGLHDMHGNVSEWCRDGYSPKLIGGTDPEMELPALDRVRRGGSVLSQTTACRSAFRGRDVPARRWFDLGFRVVIVNVAENSPMSSIGTKTKSNAAANAVPRISQIDLLRQIDVSRDSLSTKWAQPIVDGQQTMIISPDTAGTIRIPYMPSREYELVISMVKRNKGMIGVILVVGGSQVLITLDSYPEDGCISKFDVVDGKGLSFKRGRIIPMDRQCILFIEVKDQRIDVKCDGELVGTWQGDFDRLTVHPAWKVADKRNLHLCAVGQGWEVHGINLTEAKR